MHGVWRRQQVFHGRTKPLRCVRRTYQVHQRGGGSEQPWSLSSVPRGFCLRRHKHSNCMRRRKVQFTWRRGLQRLRPRLQTFVVWRQRVRALSDWVHHAARRGSQLKYPRFVHEMPERLCV